MIGTVSMHEELPDVNIKKFIDEDDSDNDFISIEISKEFNLYTAEEGLKHFTEHFVSQLLQVEGGEELLKKTLADFANWEIVK